MHLVLPVMIVAYVAAFAAFGPLVPVNSGIGWDGGMYAAAARHWPEAAYTLPQYTVGRLLPSTLIHFAARLFGADLQNTATLVLAFQIYNAVLLGLGAMLWQMTCRTMNWPPALMLVGAICLFLNYNFLIFLVYDPVLTDVSALSLGLVMLYCWVRGNLIALVVVTAMATFTWPTGLLTGALLMSFPYQQRSNLSPPSHGSVPLILGLVSIFLATAIWILSTGRMMLYNAEQIDLRALPLSTIIALGYIWYVGSQIDPRWLRAIPSSIDKIGLSVAAAIWLLSTLLVQALSQKRGFGGIDIYVLNVVHLSLVKPGAFILSHAGFLGPAFLLILLHLRMVVTEAAHAGLGALAILFFFLCSALNSESRQLSILWPFAVFFLCRALAGAKFNFTPQAMIALLAASMLLSKAYLPLWLVTGQGPFGQFPWQWFFLNNGPWMGWPGYALNLALVILSLIFLWPWWSSLRLNVFRLRAT